MKTLNLSNKDFENLPEISNPEEVEWLNCFNCPNLTSIPDTLKNLEELNGKRIK